ncbi:MAG: hypothetical protein ACOZQL_05215 [Myxococcota bacterium]
MSDELELQRAVDEATREVARLEGELGGLVGARASLTADALHDAQLRRDALAASLQAREVETSALEAERAKLVAVAETPGFQLPGPLRWTLTSAALVVYVASLISLYRWVRSPGLVFFLVAALPVALVALVVAGSLRESAIDERAARADPDVEGAPRGDPAAGEGAARLALGAGPDEASRGGGATAGDAAGGDDAARGPPGGGDAAT